MKLEPAIDRMEFEQIVETQEYGDLKLDLLVGEYQSSLVTSIMMINYV
jgi:exonuclease VII small subunit